MIVSIKETGGYAGLSRVLASIDTDTSGALGERIGDLVKAARFFELPARVGTAAGFDLMYYAITVSDGNRQHSVEYASNDSGPEIAGLRELVQAALSGSA